MVSFSPYLVRLYWGGNFSYVNGVVQHDHSMFTTSFIITHKKSFDELVESVWNNIQIQKASVSVKLLLGYTFQGMSQTSQIFNEEGVKMLHYLAETTWVYFVADIYVEWRALPPFQQISFNNLLYGMCNRNVPYREQEDRG